MNSSVRSRVFSLTHVLSIAAVSISLFLTAIAPGQANAQTQATATVDQASLLQTEHEFKVTGTASNARSLQVLLVPGEYTGPTDWKSVNGAILANRSYNVNATAQVVKGVWTAVFVKSGRAVGVPFGTYTLAVYDISKEATNPSAVPTFLTKATLEVRNTATASVDPNSLTQTTKEFMVNGTASGATSLQVFLLPGEYTGATDWSSVNAAVGGSRSYNVSASAQVVRGKWEAPFVKGGNAGGVPSGTYTLAVFDLSQFKTDSKLTPTLLTKETLTVKNSISTKVPTVTVDQSSLFQTTSEFRITGTASNISLMQLVLLSGEYTGPTDWDSVNAARGSDTPYNVNATAQVEKGKWAGAFVKSNNSKGVPSGSYTLLVFDISKELKDSKATPVFLTKSTVVVKNSVLVARPYCSMAPSKLVMKFGEPVTISWISKNATSANLQPGSGPVDLRGSIKETVQYTNQTLPFVKKWTLTVEGPGGSITCTAVVRYVLPETSAASIASQTLIAAAVMPFSAVVEALSDMFVALGI